MVENLNTKPQLGINFNDLPAGSFIIKDGKLLPNLDDEAMLQRAKGKEQIAKNEDRDSEDKNEIKKDRG